jgi:hypothetical protein
MSNPFGNLESRAAAYVIARDMRLEQELGHGKDGTVYATDFATAVKVFVRHDAFLREKACYERLRERGIDEILGHSVPLFIQADDELWTIEMSTVDRPFLLDFASAYLDYPPDFSPEILKEWEEEKQELFGENWAHVRRLLQTLENSCDVYLFDVHPGNITFADAEP